MDIEKLIEQLRTESLYADKASLEIMDLCMDAATALSALQAENAKLKKERDAAITDLEELIAGSWDAACEYCAKLHSKEPCREEDGSCKPKWRGIQEGVEGDR